MKPDDVEDTIFRNASAPILEDVKDFLRFVALASKSDLTKNGRMSAESLVTEVENFFRAFTDKTGIETDPKQHSEIYHVRGLIITTGLVTDDHNLVDPVRSNGRRFHRGCYQA